MTFQDWITRKYVEWRGDTVTGRSITKFAQYLGVSQALMNNWMQGDRMPGRKSIQLLAQKYPEIYEVLNISSPESQEELDKLPPSFRERLARATHEVNSVLKQKGLTGEDPEAERITIAIFEKYGFKYTSTETVPDKE